MRHTSRKRQSLDPLARVDASTWLVMRDRIGRVLKSTELARNADLRAVLTTARKQRLEAGWAAETIGAARSFFFASRASERMLIGIERLAPRGRESCRPDQ